MMQSRSSVPEGPRHWIKIKPLSPSFLRWGHLEWKDVINQAINLTPEASGFGFLPCSSSVVQGRGRHPADPLIPARRVLTRQHRSREMLSTAVMRGAPVGEVSHHPSMVSLFQLFHSLYLCSGVAGALPFGDTGTRKQSFLVHPVLAGSELQCPWEGVPKLCCFAWTTFGPRLSRGSSSGR